MKKTTVVLAAFAALGAFASAKLEISTASSMEKVRPRDAMADLLDL